MPITLNGQEVRRRAAERASAVAETNSVETSSRQAGEHLQWLSQKSEIPVGTLHNVTRGNNPQTISLTRMFRIASALRQPGEKISQTVAAIVAEGDVTSAPSAEAS